MPQFPWKSLTLAGLILAAPLASAAESAASTGKAKPAPASAPAKAELPPLSPDMTAKLADLTARVTALPTATVPAKLKKAALGLALEQAQAQAAAGLGDQADALLGDVAQALPQDLGRERTAPETLSYLPALHTTTGNPYLANLAAWAKDQLAKPDIPWGASTPTASVFTGTGKDYGTRDEAAKTATLFWLVAHPQSPYRHDPELFTRMLRRAQAYVDAYLIHGNAYSDSLNDFFAIGPACHNWLAIDAVWPDLILPSQRARWNATLSKVGDFWLKVHRDTQNGPYRMGHYANRDLGVANILVNAGLLLHDQDCLEAAKSLVHAQQDNFYPDGAFAYIGTQNESTGYHDADTTFLARYLLVTGDPVAKDLLIRSQWYGVLSTEPALVAEYWTAPSWKHTWNGSVSLGTEAVAGLSGNPYLRTLLDRRIAQQKPTAKAPAPADPLAAMFYRGDVTARPLPDRYTVVDRNLEGVRARYGRFSYAITTRKSGADEPGKPTLVGAMTLAQDLSKNYPLNAVLMGAMPKVRAPSTDKKKLDWAWLTRDDRATVILGQQHAAVADDYALHQSASATKGGDVPWNASQDWLCVQDRMFGLIRVSPQGRQQAAEVTAVLRLGTGGTAGGPPQQMVHDDPTTYRFGDLVVQVHASTFASHAPEDIKVRTSTGCEIVFRDGRGGGDTLKDYAADQAYECLVEIRPAWRTEALEPRLVGAKDGVVGLEVRSATTTWTLWHNRTAAQARVDLGLDPARKPAALQRGQAPGKAPEPAPGQTSLAPGERVLVVAGGDPAHQGAAWPSYEALVGSGSVPDWTP